MRFDGTDANDVIRAGDVDADGDLIENAYVQFDILAGAGNDNVSITRSQDARLYGGEGDDSIKSWLEKSGLESNQRVAQKLKVESGWEKAVETVLGDYLQAVCVRDITPVTESIAALQAGEITILREQTKDDFAGNVESTLAEKAPDAPPAIIVPCPTA